MSVRMLVLVLFIGGLLAPRTGSAITPGLDPRIADQYIVAIKAGRDAQDVARTVGVTPKHVYGRVLNGFAATLNPGQRTALERHPDVMLVEPDQVVQATGAQTIDPASGLWGLDRIDQRALPLSSSYSYGTSGAGVTAYLIDSGLQANHPDFGTRAQNVYDPTGGTGADCHGHGTHLAGIIGGTTHGVAKAVALRGVRVLDCDALGTVSNAIRGIDWVAANATKPAVATIAFSPYNLDSGNSGTLQLAVENLIASGVFVAVSAGNANVDACTVTPANVATAFTVAASIRTDQRYAASNYGTCVDSYAPGSGITSAWIGSTTSTLSGTSQATAFVAGVAALYQSSAGTQTPAAIHSWLIANATPDAIQGDSSGTPNRLLYSPFLAPPPPITRKSVSAGYVHTCGVRTDQTLACWGSNTYGQATPPSGTFTQVSAGYFHTCGVRTNQTVACWGRNSDGQATPPSGTFTQVSGGEQHTCGVRTNQTLACWGSNRDGQTIPPSGSFTQVSAGNLHTCAVRTDQTLACWGRNRYGQSTPPSGSFTQVSAGGGHTCGVRTDTTMACWGFNLNGEGTPRNGSFLQISAGDSHTCALRTDQTLVCWGNNTAGQVISSSDNFLQVSTGDSHTCALRTDQTLVCWGSNTYGQATPPSNF
ncbi:MAG TPA: S8 family serine peptidase [Herpetosiphonaceae bacterium]